MSVEQVVNARDKILGSIGALLVFVGAFLPWAAAEYAFFGYSFGSYGFVSPQAWLCALAGIAAAVLLLRRRSGTLVLGLGVLMAAWALVFGLSVLGGGMTPSWGFGCLLIGGALLIYSGYMTRRYEG